MLHWIQLDLLTERKYYKDINEPVLPTERSGHVGFNV
jgi:hypothetical protein